MSDSAALVLRRAGVEAADRVPISNYMITGAVGGLVTGFMAPPSLGNAGHATSEEYLAVGITIMVAGLAMAAISDDSGRIRDRLSRYSHEEAEVYLDSFTKRLRTRRLIGVLTSSVVGTLVGIVLVYRILPST